MKLVDSTATLSDYTKATLTQFGWKEGDAIPEELGAYLVQCRAQLPPSKRSDVLVDVGAMSEEMVAHAKGMLAEARELGRKQATTEAKAAEANDLLPAAQELYRQIQRFEDDEPEIIDDLASAPAPAAPTPPVELPPVPAAAVEANPADEPMAILPFCPRCGWNMQQKFEVVVTDTDKEDFLASILGHTRFKRQHEILGGQVKFVFKTILAEHNKMLHRQLVEDQKAKQIETEPEWFVRMFEYRLALSLDSIITTTADSLRVIPAFGEVPKLEGENDLQALWRYVNNEALDHEVTRRLAGVKLREFQRLVEALEAMALEPSFWSGIAQQP